MLWSVERLRKADQMANRKGRVAVSIGRRNEGWPKPPPRCTWLCQSTRQSPAAAADVQPIDLVLQQRDGIVRVLQVRHQIGRGASDITRDVRVFDDRFVEVDD